MATLTRRAALVAALAAIPAIAARGQSGGEFWLDLRDDWGAAIPNLRVPAVLDPFRLPGLLWYGPAAADVYLFEFFDYNCSVCRTIAPQIDRMVREAPGLRLGLVHNPILSPQSREAARVSLEVLRLAGPRAAYELHLRLYRSRGTMNGPRARAIAQEIIKKVGVAGESGHDLDAISAQADDEVEAALSAQEKLASGMGFSVTPSFVLNGMALIGNPGPDSLSRMVEAVRRCDALVCP